MTGRRTRRPPAARRAARTVLALALLAAAGCAPRPPANVVLILVDTLRASHLELYGYRRRTAPHLAAFARDNLLFEDVRSQAPCTYPSANSILTGRDGTAFWIQPGDRIGIPAGIPSLAELLAERGYGTAAVSASPIVRRTPSPNNRHGGFGRGFDHFDESCLWADAGCVDRKGLELLDSLPRPFFLYLHFMDPHDPYRPTVHEFATPYHGKWFVEAGDPNPICDQVEGRPAPRFDVTRRDLDHLEDLYDDEIASFDRRFGELLAALEGRGLLETTLVAVVADHGEEFMEHGDVKHCHTVYDTEIETPMVLHLPGVRGGRTFAAQVENLDLVPTILDYLGPGRTGATTTTRLDGTSLRPLIEAGEAVHPVVFSAWGSLRAAKAGRFKLVYDLALRRAELYDLDADPGETRDVSAAHPREVDRLEHALSRRIREVEGSADEAQALARGQAAARRLTALGYVK